MANTGSDRTLPWAVGHFFVGALYSDQNPEMRVLETKPSPKSRSSHNSSLRPIIVPRSRTGSEAHVRVTAGEPRDSVRDATRVEYAVVSVSRTT